MIRAWAAVVVVAVVTLVAAFVAGYAVGSWQPGCPSEDSCMPVYEDGEWNIRPTIP